MQSVTECYRVLHIVKECYGVLQSVAECCRVLQSISSASTLTNFWACLSRLGKDLTKKSPDHLFKAFLPPSETLSYAWSDTTKPKEGRRSRQPARMIWKRGTMIQ